MDKVRGLVDLPANHMFQFSEVSQGTLLRAFPVLISSTNKQMDVSAVITCTWTSRNQTDSLLVFVYAVTSVSLNVVSFYDFIVTEEKIVTLFKLF